MFLKITRFLPLLLTAAITPAFAQSTAASTPEPCATKPRPPHRTTRKPAASKRSAATPSVVPEILIVKPHLTVGEERRIGETARPEWTGARRFSGTRVYIQKEPWEVGIEQWWRVRHKRDGSVEHRLQEEIEIGLPYRMQLDLYGNIEGDNTGAFHFDNLAVELRWALADWGVLWGNPTLYGEYKFADEHWNPDVYEFKLLLGDELAPRWHWGVNFVWEAQVGGEREHEFQVTSGLSYSVVDGKIGIGVETKYDRVTARGARGDDENIFLIGPSVQFRLTEHLHVDLNCLFGTNQDSPRQEGFLVIGYDFGKSGGGSQTKPARYSPISTRSN